MSRSLSFALACAALAASAALSWAQLPQTRLSSVYPAGGKAGGDTAVSLAGTDLDDVTALRFNHAGITAAPKMAEAKPGDKGPQVVPNEFTVTIKPDVRPGIYAVAVLHDENENDEMDFNFLGMPLEGYGFSNDAAAMFGPPSFEAAAFKLSPRASYIPIKIRYFP